MQGLLVALRLINCEQHRKIKVSKSLWETTQSGANISNGVSIILLQPVRLYEFVVLVSSVLFERYLHDPDVVSIKVSFQKCR